MSYVAVIAKIVNVRKHPGADRLNIASALGNTVVVDLSTIDGTLGVFFGPDGALSHEMCTANDLYARTNPETGAHEGGFFGKNRRVRSQKFRGEKSDGFWCPLSLLEWTGIDLSTLKEGDTFTELNGKEVCRKYYTPATWRQMNQPKTRKKLINFPEFDASGQFRNELGKIPEGSVLWITEKLHGTQQRVANVLDEYGCSWWHRILYKLLGKEPKEFTTLYGSHHVILEKSTGVGYYGSDAFRYKSTEYISLPKNWIIYGECVGFTDAGRPIMEPQPTADLKDIQKKYGDRMLYKYGALENECRFYGFRVVITNDAGNTIDLPWVQTRKVFRDLGIPTVPFLIGPIVYDGDMEKLRTLVEALHDGDSTLDNSHIREGVVVRVEKPNGEIDYLKSKNWTFCTLEGIYKQNDNAVDLEEVS